MFCKLSTSFVMLTLVLLAPEPRPADDELRVVATRRARGELPAWIDALRRVERVDQRLELDCHGRRHARGGCGDPLVVGRLDRLHVRSIEPADLRHDVRWR